MNRTRVLIAGAAGRDFHNFNLVYRGREQYQVVGFTATQIPNIDGRVYPAELAGELYPAGIPIWPEADLERAIARNAVDEDAFAGIAYAAILDRAEQAADVILWDGGNNDTPFIKPNLHVVVVDPHRPGHELRYHPGETNLRMADVCVVNKMDSAPQEGVDAVLGSIRTYNEDAKVVLAASPFHVDGDPASIAGKRVLAVA